ncbi:MAG: GDP-mannose 4,6-dehydratase [bacterium]|nr:GDP-mannose 4,6-dehydratase [bacterium]
MSDKKEFKRILITGGAGFIGSNLIAELRHAGDYDIVVVDDESLGRFSHIAEWSVECIKADIRDHATMATALRDVDTVVHLAADTRVLDSIADPQKNFDVNVAGTFHLLRLSRDAGVQTFINASTGGAILGEVPPPVHERMAPHPISPYGASKLAAEGYLSAFAGAYGMRTVSLRFSNIYGPNSYHKGSVVAHFFKQLQRGEEIVVYGDGSQVRDYLFVGDLAKGIHSSIRSGMSGVFQLGSGQPTSLNQLLQEIRMVVGTGIETKVRYEPFRKGEIHSTWCDITKAVSEIGFKPSTRLEDGLRVTWNWFGDNQ